MVLEFSTEYDKVNVLVYAILQNNWITDKNVMGKPNFVGFELKISFEGMFSIATGLGTDLALHTDTAVREDTIRQI